MFLGSIEIIILAAVILFVVFSMRKSEKAVKILTGLGLLMLLLAFALFYSRLSFQKHESVASRQAIVSIEVSDEIVRGRHSTNGVVQRYDIAHQLRNGQKMEIHQLTQNYVPDKHPTRLQAAASLARQLAAKIRRDVPKTQKVTLSLTLDGFRNSGETATESVEILDHFIQAFHSQQQNGNVRVNKTIKPGNETSAVALQLERADDGKDTVLALSLTINDTPIRLFAMVSQKDWLEKDAIRDDGRRYVEFGSNDENDKNYVIKLAAERMMPVLVTNWDRFQQQGPNLRHYPHDKIEDISRFVVENSISDDFNQKFTETISHKKRDPPDERRYVLVDYSDENLASAIRAAEVVFGETNTSIVHASNDHNGPMPSSPFGSQRTKVGWLVGTMGIYAMAYLFMQFWDRKRIAHGS